MKIPRQPPDYSTAMREIIASNRLLKIIDSGIQPAQDDRYRHWDTLRHLPPPDDLTHEEWWAGIKMARSFIRHTVPLKDIHGIPMEYTTPDIVHKLCSMIDRSATGSIQANEPIIHPSDREFYIFKSLSEEAITSSQLEGASTTREVAKEMIRSGRQPLDKSERMIYNNFQAMSFIRRIKDQPLTPEIIFEIHEMLTDGTMDDPGAAGRLRREDEQIKVYDDSTGEILHVPPSAAELEARMNAMCAFANDIDSGKYIHPVVRAIILHFWLAYDHPFVDGNGRTARALFYWLMARQGYWLFEFISISRIIHGAPARYARAFLYTETDDCDITYFILNQLAVIRRSIDDLHEYLHRKEAELLEVRDFLTKSNLASAMFNHRQMAVLNHALHNAYAVYTVETHKRSHGVSTQTARTDLLELGTQGLLIQQKRGRSFIFVAPPDLRKRIRKVSITDETERPAGLA